MGIEKRSKYFDLESNFMQLYDASHWKNRYVTDPYGKLLRTPIL